jgi:hypothetical protein
MNKTQSTTFAKTVSQKLNNKFPNLKFKLQDGSVNPDSTYEFDQFSSFQNEIYNLTRESEDKPNRTIKFKFMIIDDKYFYYYVTDIVQAINHSIIKFDVITDETKVKGGKISLNQFDKKLSL